MKIISFKICPFVQRVTALLEAKGLAYDVEYISLKDKPDWFLDLSPHGQVPLLITDSGAALFESDAIIEYINEFAGQLQADLGPEERAFDRAWSYAAAKFYLVQCSAMRSANAEVLAERAEKLRKLFIKAEQQLALRDAAGDVSKGQYFKGEHLSQIDIAWLPLLHRAEIIRCHSGYDFLAALPKVKAWQQALMQTGLAEKSVAPDFVQRFGDFYLSEQTFLGGRRECEPTADTACASGACC
ncbi:glutathione S-transferase family protein [Agaribacterium haliotis]|uniref:glutathione S-transferase family protein n=1 Tax=Agaribacterium haliotis TaxID=2013869 RepID=UPI000BB55244|nr:glutathione S-transferase family protein [Agaribacterium haliotis]